MAIIIHGTITYDGTKRDDALAAIDKVVSATRNEDGCLEYKFTVDLFDPNVLHLFEVWRDQAAVDAHMATPHLAEFLGKAAEFGVTGTEIYKREGGDPSPLM